MSQSGVARTDSPAVASPRPPASLFFLRCTKASTMALSDLKRGEATFITAAKKMLNRRGASTHLLRRPCSTANHLEHILSSSRTHARMPMWNCRMTEIILCGMPKRASTVQRRVESTESYALVRSIRHTYSGIRFFRASSCNRRITNIMSVVERFGRKPLCSSGRIPTRSQYSMRRQAMIFSSILLACATSEMPLQLPHSVQSFGSWSTMMMASFHYCGTSSPLQIRTTISSKSPAQGEITVEGDLEKLNRDSVWSDSLSIRQRADGVCQLLHRGLNS